MEQKIARRIAYQEWAGLISSATDFDHLHRLMVEYLAEWSKSDLLELPEGLSNPVLRGAEEIVERALIATRAELTGDAEAVLSTSLREMALTFTAAATRFRRLQANGPHYLSIVTKQRQ